VAVVFVTKIENDLAARRFDFFCVPAMFLTWTPN
jgi:hypothetical protein